ncbi:DNA polymerase III subunit epsilon [Hydromonas duriensis]|uniref:DNA polymerase III subunit epsilon n=1 Tax=Hydromonas duriensis TaxID=1527608 RepID=A0A4R6Y596_9BURK|nr:DNA polymerase III subunit epsilon [Hydromonas duriensis]TDR30196.1 DNA polymerase III epsilon subunit [Hydromonas duriensis]
MRYVILDTETTGLDPNQGHKLVEVGCVEMVNRQLTGRHFHHYLNPQRESDEGALNVHGLTTEFLSDKPLFKAIAGDLLEFVRDATVLIHNASFDTKFLNAELSALGMDTIQSVCTVEDTLAMAKQMFPGKRNNLDALCERLGVSNAHRVLHGALLDAEILAEVYLAMTRGQETLSMAFDAESSANKKHKKIDVRQLELPLIMVSEQDSAEHLKAIEAVAKKSKDGAVWGAAVD